MAAFTLEFEQRRLSEQGIHEDTRQQSVADQLWAVLAERTGTLNPFLLEAKQEIVTGRGFEQRGDLTKTYRKSQEVAGSQRIAERFRLETDGYNEVKKLFFKIPPYSTVLLFSPPPEIPIEGYPGYSLTYFYHILPGESEDKRIIKSLSWINYFDKEEQAEILNYFLGKEKVEPTEDSLLLNPVGLCEFTEDTKSLRTIWEKIEEVYYQKERKFWLPPFSLVEGYLLHGQKIRERKHQILAKMVEEVATMIVEGKGERELKEPWAIMLNLADQRLLHEDVSLERPAKEYVFASSGETAPAAVTIFADYAGLNYEPRAVATQCGSSGGIGEGRGGLFGGQEQLFTTRTFEVEREGGEICQVCRQSNKDSHYHCPSCERKYKDETNSSKEQRTKECSCGFKFGC